MQTNPFVKIKNFLKRLFSKKTKKEVVENTEDSAKELVAFGFTTAPEHYTLKKEPKN